MILEAIPSDLESHESSLYGTLRDGLALFQKRYGHYRGVMTTTGERMNVHDCLREVAKTYFPNEYRERGQLFELVLDSYRVRLKKLDPYLRPSNYHTQAVFEFMNQIGVLFDDLDPISLVLGYIPNGIDITKSDLWLMKPQGVGASPVWQYRLQPDSGDISMSSFPTTSPNVPDSRQPRVKPKSDLKPSKQKNSY